MHQETEMKPMEKSPTKEYQKPGEYYAIPKGELKLEKKSEPALTGDQDFDKMLRDVMETLDSKGAEYTMGSVDRLHNFRTVGEFVGIPMEKVWAVYVYKHFSAVMAYIKNNCHVKSNEPIEGRIMDVIVYFVLFAKMVREIQDQRGKPEEAAYAYCPHCEFTGWTQDEFRKHLGDAHGC